MDALLNLEIDYEHGQHSCYRHRCGLVSRSQEYKVLVYELSAVQFAVFQESELLAVLDQNAHRILAIAVVVLGIEGDFGESLGTLLGGETGDDAVDGVKSAALAAVVIKRKMGV